MLRTSAISGIEYQKVHARREAGSIELFIMTSCRDGALAQDLHLAPKRVEHGNAYVGRR